MLDTIVLAVMVFVVGFLVYYVLKKALKMALLVLCVGVVFVALKYFLGVI